MENNSKLSKRFDRVEKKNLIVRYIDWILIGLLIAVILYAKFTGLYCNYDRVCENMCREFIMSGGYLG